MALPSVHTLSARSSVGREGVSAGRVRGVGAGKRHRLYGVRDHLQRKFELGRAGGGLGMEGWLRAYFEERLAFGSMES